MSPHILRSRYLAIGLIVVAAHASAQQTRSTTVGTGWAQSSVNTVIFRTNSVVSHGHVQYTAYYDDSTRVVLAKRTLGAAKWTVQPTAFTNDVKDAHNAIVIAVDGRGILHVAWAEHSRALHYARALKPGSLELGPSEPMTGQHETQVTYPQFYLMRGGDLVFVYRDGQSGRGDVMLNRWNGKAWRAVAHPLISGEGERNAYMNTLAVDAKGGWHLSWTWRESPDVATNHDVMYAFSPDGGSSWRTSDAKPYTLPITAKNAEIAWAVPQGSELINQTSMTVDGAGHPLIATYWRTADSDVPQFRLVWNDGKAWHANQVGARTQPFRLSGGGTKRIPISRPIVVAGLNGVTHVVFRDEERGAGIYVATSRDAAHSNWKVSEIGAMNVGLWEPTYDVITWQRTHQLHLFVQRVGQGDGETLENVPPQPVTILEWTPR